MNLHGGYLFGTPLSRERSSSHCTRSMDAWVRDAWNPCQLLARAVYTWPRDTDGSRRPDLAGWSPGHKVLSSGNQGVPRVPSSARVLVWQVMAIKRLSPSGKLSIQVHQCGTYAPSKGQERFRLVDGISPMHRGPAFLCDYGTCGDKAKPRYSSSEVLSYSVQNEVLTGDHLDMHEPLVSETMVPMIERCIS